VGLINSIINRFKNEIRKKCVGNLFYIYICILTKSHKREVEPRIWSNVSCTTFTQRFF
jgi:hypothetical protein